MRKKVPVAKISVSKATHKRLKEDRNHFQETINGGAWSIDDTIKEYFKIIDTKKGK